MLISLFKRHQHLISAWTITEFEKVGPNLRLQAQVTLGGGSVLFIRQVVLAETMFKYAYHWQSEEGDLICRWDNAPHWPDIPSYPHHKHVVSGNEILVQESHGGDFDEVFEEIATIMNAAE